MCLIFWYVLRVLLWAFSYCSVWLTDKELEHFTVILPSVLVSLFSKHVHKCLSLLIVISWPWIKRHSTNWQHSTLEIDCHEILVELDSLDWQEIFLMTKWPLDFSDSIAFSVINPTRHGPFWTIFLNLFAVVVVTMREQKGLRISYNMYDFYEKIGRKPSKEEIGRKISRTTEWILPARQSLLRLALLLLLTKR